MHEKIKEFMPYDVEPLPQRLPYGIQADRETTSRLISLERLEHEITRNRLDDIAELIRALTYGEMMEFAADLWGVRGDGFEGDGLPTALHRWAKERGGKK